MLIWINGPMGVGKTQVAHELAHCLPGSFVCDPELLGIAIRRMMPPNMRTEFQEYPVWRSGVRELAADLAAGFDGIVLVPMTILDEFHHDEIVGGLISQGHDVSHFTLMASRATLLKRLRSRGDGKRSYGAVRIDACLAALNRSRFATHLHTDGLGVSAVVEEIARLVGVELQSSGNRLHQRRLMVTLRHIR